MNKKVLALLTICLILVLSIGFAGCEVNCDKKGHAWGEWSVTTAATCATEGVETRICQNHNEHTETRPIDKLPVYWGEWTVVTAATCEAAGSKTRASQNDSTYTETVAIPALGHDFGEWAVTTEPTYATAGVETRVCANDATHTETRPVAKLTPEITFGANYSDSITVVANDITTAASPAKVDNGSEVAYGKKVEFQASFHTEIYTFKGVYVNGVAAASSSVSVGADLVTYTHASVQGAVDVEFRFERKLFVTVSKIFDGDNLGAEVDILIGNDAVGHNTAFVEELTELSFIVNCSDSTRFVAWGEYVVDENNNLKLVILNDVSTIYKRVITKDTALVALFAEASAEDTSVYVSHRAGDGNASDVVTTRGEEDNLRNIVINSDGTDGKQNIMWISMNEGFTYNITSDPNGLLSVRTALDGAVEYAITDNKEGKVVVTAGNGTVSVTYNITINYSKKVAISFATDDAEKGSVSATFNKEAFESGDEAVYTIDGNTVRLAATPLDGYAFGGWYLDGVCISYSRYFPYEVPFTAQNVITAKWVEEGYGATVSVDKAYGNFYVEELNFAYDDVLSFGATNAVFNEVDANGEIYAVYVAVDEAGATIRLSSGNTANASIEQVNTGVYRITVTQSGQVTFTVAPANLAAETTTYRVNVTIVPAPVVE